MKRQANSIHPFVGVIIAIVANTWTTRIIPPFLWGLIWCSRLALLPGGPRRQTGRPLLALYAAEYVRAVTGSLIVSVVVGSLKALFRYAILG